MNNDLNIPEAQYEAILHLALEKACKELCGWSPVYEGCDVESVILEFIDQAKKEMNYE